MTLLPIHPAGKSCSDLGRVLVLNDPPERLRDVRRGLRAAGGVG